MASKHTQRYLIGFVYPGVQKPEEKLWLTLFFNPNAGSIKLDFNLQATEHYSETDGIRIDPDRQAAAQNIAGQLKTALNETTPPVRSFVKLIKGNLPGRRIKSDLHINTERGMATLTIWPRPKESRESELATILSALQNIAADTCIMLNGEKGALIDPTDPTLRTTVPLNTVILAPTRSLHTPSTREDVPPNYAGAQR